MHLLNGLLAVIPFCAVDDLCFFVRRFRLFESSLSALVICLFALLPCACFSSLVSSALLSVNLSNVDLRLSLLLPCPPFRSYSLTLYVSACSLYPWWILFVVHEFSLHFFALHLLFFFTFFLLYVFNLIPAFYPTSADSTKVTVRAFINTRNILLCTIVRHAFLNVIAFYTAY